MKGKIYKEPERNGFQCSVKAIVISLIAVVSLIYVVIAFHASFALDSFISNNVDVVSAMKNRFQTTPPAQVVKTTQNLRAQAIDAAEDKKKFGAGGMRTFLNPIEDYRPRIPPSSASNPNSINSDPTPNIPPPKLADPRVPPTPPKFAAVADATLNSKYRSQGDNTDANADARIPPRGVHENPAEQRLRAMRDRRDEVNKRRVEPPLDIRPSPPSHPKQAESISDNSGSKAPSKTTQVPEIINIIKTNSADANGVEKDKDTKPIADIKAEVKINKAPPRQIVSKHLQKRDEEVLRSDSPPPLPPTPQEIDEKLAAAILDEVNKRRPVGDSPPIEDNNSQQLSSLDNIEDKELTKTEAVTDSKSKLEPTDTDVKQNSPKKDEDVSDINANTKAATTAPVIVEEKVQTCEDGNDPWVGQPVDAFKPPKGASPVDYRKWKQAVEKMMAELASQKMGGEPLRSYIRDQVNKLELLRLELFCPYLSPKIPSK